MPPGMLKKEKKEQERPMGQGMMRGSNTPWAQGPANFRNLLVASPVFPREGVTWLSKADDDDRFEQLNAFVFYLLSHIALQIT